MENKIRHVGIVESVVGECIKVRIVQSSACALCKAARQCHASESKEKTVDIHTTADMPKFEVGEKVVVMASYNVGLIAVSLAMLVPLLLMLIVLAVFTTLGYDEMISALISLMALIPYYLALFLFRKQINRKVTFRIEKID